MATADLLLFTILGGALALFVAAGWSSYKDKKLPETALLFRWFVAGSFTAGLAAYAYLFGAGGDPTNMFKSIGESLELGQVVETLTSAVGPATDASSEGATTANKKVAGGDEELKVGMPNF